MGLRSWYSVLLVCFAVLRFTIAQQQPVWGSTCGDVSTAFELRPNIPLEETNNIGILGVGEQACFKINLTGSVNQIVVALTSENWDLQLDVLSPRDYAAGVRVASTATTTNVFDNTDALLGGARNYRMRIKNAEKGLWQFTVSNLDSRRLAEFSLVVYLGNDFAPKVHKDDLETINLIRSFCCEYDSTCQLWKDLGDPEDACSIPGWKCNPDGHLTDMVLIGGAGGLGLDCEFRSNLFSQLASLERLQLRWHTELKGSINFTELAKLQNLKHLDLAYTGLAGTVPCTAPESLQHLITLDLTSLPFSDQFTGFFPECYLKKSDMEILRLSNNDFIGNFFGGKYTKKSQLRWLSVTKNQLSGSIPGPTSGGLTYQGFGRFPHLQVLQLAKNKFLGPIPSSLNQPSLLVMDLSGNTLSGNIPPSILGQPYLRSLNLAGNQLDGSIPNELLSMTNLSEIILSDNQLTGSLPDNWSEMKQLLWLDVARNSLSGPIPASLLGLPRLIALDLSRNMLEGPLPDLPFVSSDSVTRLVAKNLRYLLLSNNQLTGPLPNSFQYLPGFTSDIATDVNNNPLSYTYDFAFNKLSGDLPEFVFSQSTSSRKNLTFIDNNALQCPRGYGNGLGILCTTGRQAVTRRAPSGGGIAGIVIGVVACLAVAGILVGLILYRRRRNAGPAVTQGQDTESLQDGSSGKIAWVKKMWRSISHREPTYVKFAGDVEPWSFRK